MNICYPLFSMHGSGVNLMHCSVNPIIILVGKLLEGTYPPG
jgi:hypothetical protein